MEGTKNRKEGGEEERKKNQIRSGFINERNLVVPASGKLFKSSESGKSTFCAAKKVVLTFARWHMSQTFHEVPLLWGFLLLTFSSSFVS